MFRMFGFAVEILSGVEIIRATAAVIGLELIVSGAYAVEVLTGVRTGLINGGASNIAIEVNACGLATVMIALEVVSASPLEELLCCC